MIIVELINKDQKTFNKLCEEHNVKSLFAFGSAVTDKFDFERSDIDLLVEIEEPDPIEKGEMIMSFWDKMEEFFKRKVDLLSSQTIRNPFLRQSINNSKVLIYGTSK